MHSAVPYYNFITIIMVVNRVSSRGEALPPKLHSFPPKYLPLIKLSAPNSNYNNTFSALNIT